MPAHAAQPLPSVTPQEMEFMIARTGLHLNAGQVADLVLAWRQLSALSAAIPRRPDPADDFAFAFQLPPPRVRGAKAAAKPAGKTQTGNTRK